MKLIKVVILGLALAAPLSALALEGDQQVEYTDALTSGNVKMVKKYLDGGLSVNEQFFAWSALHISANHDQLEVVKLLIERGADPNYRHPITKMTPLTMAAIDGFTDVVEYLLSKGGDPNIKLRGNVSVLRIVRDNGDAKMAELLESKGAKDDGCQGECF
ncbi:MAG: ankyrin repeat domain-containing protein [Methylobacillus sp.]|jgi:ankyrin repeat protein|nr:ankyrin repeat domain-containing protein [Methylobacillus sp.]